MNTNDVDRYYRRTGNRWSGDKRPLHVIRGEFHVPKRIALLLLIPGVITGIALLFDRF